MPSRADTAPIALASILPQVSRLWLFLDRFEAIPPYAEHEKIAVLRSQDVGDLRANGKLAGIAHENHGCTFFAVDDDVEYPPDYGDALESYLDRFGGRVVVGVHAGVLERPMTSYVRDTRFVHRRSPLKRAAGVDLLGTDSIAFRSSALSVDVRDWDAVNMVDLSFALTARSRSIPLVAVPRKKAWVKPLAERQSDSIWLGVKEDDTRQTALALELLELPRPPLPKQRWPRRLSYRSA